MSIGIDLSDRVVLVTGGTRGIGAGIASVFLRAGAEVYVCSRNAAPNPPAGDGRQAHFLPADVRDPQQVEDLLTTIVERSGRLDVVVNNAGGSPAAETAEASVRFHSKVIELNLVAPLLVSQHAWRLMKDQSGGGSIIMIGSVSGRRPSPRTAAYGAAKAGLDNLASTLAVEFAPRVRVNSVVVGVAQAAENEDHYGDAGKQAEIAKTVPMSRFAAPEDIGNVCAFLASPLASYVTGASVAVHGGGEVPPYLAVQEGT